MSFTQQELSELSVTELFDLWADEIISNNTINTELLKRGLNPQEQLRIYRAIGTYLMENE